MILAAILLLWGCIAETGQNVQIPRGVFVSLTVRPERMSSVTRTADETAIRDLNLYLYDDNSNVVLHRYQTSATLRFECLPGDYRIRITVNMGRDLGENPASEDFTVSYADEYNVLPMAYEGDITIIPSADGMLTLPAVEVQRCVSKISYNITVVRPLPTSNCVPCSFFPYRVLYPCSIWRPHRRMIPTTIRIVRRWNFPDSRPRATAICYPICRERWRPLPTSVRRTRRMPPANASYLLIRAVRGSKDWLIIFISEETTLRISTSGRTYITGSTS